MTADPTDSCVTTSPPAPSPIDAIDLGQCRPITGRRTNTTPAVGQFLLNCAGRALINVADIDAAGIGHRVSLVIDPQRRILALPAQSQDLNTRAVTRSGGQKAYLNLASALIDLDRRKDADVLGVRLLSLVSMRGGGKALCFDFSRPVLLQPQREAS